MVLQVVLVATSKAKRQTTKKIKFEINPLQTVLDKIESNKSDTYAQALSYNVSSLFYETLEYKIKKKENISIEVIGTTRSGKSSVAAAIEIYIAWIRRKLKLAKHRLSVDSFCRDQNDFSRKIKDMDHDDLFRSPWVVDETRRAIFQSGSVAQQAGLLDFNNICAIYELSIAWLNPQRFDTSHNSQYALHVWGRDDDKKLTRCLIYDINSQDMFARVPLGYVVVDVSTFVGTPLEEEYLELKWVRVKQQKEQNISSSSESKREIAMAISSMPEWDSMKNRRQRKVLIQSIIGEMYPNEVIEEIIELCAMIPYLPKSDKLKKDFKQKIKRGRRNR